MNSLLRGLYKTISLSVLIQLFKTLKAGLYTTLFLPVAGPYLSWTIVAMPFFLRIIAIACIGAPATLYALCYGLPSLMGSLYFKAYHEILTGKTHYAAKTFQVTVPLACMALFIMNPVGSKASLYTLYWIFPCLFPLMPHRSTFLAALASSLTMHAVGSVLFIYSFPTISTFWIGLIPLVFFERFAHALAITTLYTLTRVIKKCSASPFLRLIFA